MEGRKLSEETKKKIGDANRGKPGWNKGMKGFNLGRKQSASAKEKIGKASKGERNYAWKGDDVGYRSLHYWISRWKKKTRWM